MIYIVLITFILLLSYFSNKKNENAFYYIGFSCIFIIIAFRDYEIGANDTYNYVRYFTGMQKYYDVDGIVEFEKGFLIYNSIVKNITTTGYGYIIINTIVSLSSVFLLIKLYSENKALSLLYFFLPIGSLYTLYFITLRQTLGMSFFLFGLILYLKNVKYKNFIFLLFSITGYFFHTSIVLMIVFFLLLNRVSINRKNYVISIVVSFIVGILGLLDNLMFLLNIFNIFDSVVGRLITYADSEFSIEKFSLVAITTSIMGILLSFTASEKKFNTIFVKLFLVGIVLQNIFFKFIEIYRLAGLFTIFGLVCCTFIDFNKVKLNKLDKLRILVLKSIFIVIIGYSYYKIVNDFIVYNVLEDPRKLMPYKFIFETNRYY